MYTYDIKYRRPFKWMDSTQLKDNQTYQWNEACYILITVVSKMGR